MSINYRKLAKQKIRKKKTDRKLSKTENFFGNIILFVFFGWIFSLFFPTK